MWCIFILAAIGLIVGIVFAFLEGDSSNILPFLVVGAIAGVIIAVVISVGTWIFAPTSAYELTLTNDYILKETQDGELMYFNMTHDDSTTYLYYMNDEQVVKKVYLSNAEVKFIENGQSTHIEVHQWQYKNGFLRATAILPLTKWNSITYIYISEADWLKHTEGGIEHVITHPIQD